VKTAVLRNVWNCLGISLHSGTAKNLHDPSFGEKSENFGRIGQFGEQICSNSLSFCIGAMAGNASDTAHLGHLLHFGETKNFGCSATLLAERTSSPEKNLSAAP
jgi:hypothetical protein